MSSASLTFLVDNTVMELVPDAGAAERLSEPGRNFLAEHGYSVLITTAAGARVLFDAGATDVVVPHNLALLGLDVARDLDAAVLSHGHSDHCGAVPLLRCPIYAHPGAFGYRYLQRNGQLRFDLTAHPLLAARERITLQAEPVEVAEGVWATGEVERENEWEQPKGFLRSQGTELVADPVLDDQGLAVVTPEGLVVVADPVLDDQGLAVVTPEGLVVVAGCAHAGIINTVRQAQKVTGVDRVRAVVGGLHLIDADEDKLQRTIAALREIDPEVIAPLHCTGFRGSVALAQAFPQQFIYVTGGHRLSFD